MAIFEHYAVVEIPARYLVDEGNMDEDYDLITVLDDL
jgi:hypothetical protein